MKFGSKVLGMLLCLPVHVNTLAFHSLLSRRASNPTFLSSRDLVILMSLEDKEI